MERSSVNNSGIAAGPVTGNNQMGPQSQRRNTLQKCTYLLAADSRKKRKNCQLDLFGQEAFDPWKHCVVCVRRKQGGNSHKPHHTLCWNNQRLKGVLSAAALKQKQYRIYCFRKDRRGRPPHDHWCMLNNNKYI